MKRHAFLVAMLVLVGGCGGSSGAPDGGGSCTVSFSCSSSYDCGESSAGAGSQAQQACESNGGTYSTGACSRTNAVGGCRRGSGPACFTTWIYASSGSSMEQVRQGCTQMGGTFVSP